MKRRYYVAQYGYSYPNPEPLTLAEARKELSAALNEEREKCRKRFKCGTIHRSKDSGAVTMGEDKLSQLWAHFSIKPLS